MKFARLWAMAIVLASVAHPAQAARYVFSYKFVTGTVIRGVVLGTPQSDPNLIAVDAVVGVPTIDGAAFPAADIVSGFLSYATEQILSPAFVSLDGTIVDLFVVDSLFTQGFGIASAGENNPGIVQAILGMVPYFDTFAPSHWTLTSAVPEPATWLMMVNGFGLAGIALRRRVATVA